MGSEDVVNELLGVPRKRHQLSLVRNLSSNCLVHLEDIKDLASRLASDDELYTDEQIDFWNLVDIRAGSILESLKTLDNDLRVPNPGTQVNLFSKFESMRCRKTFVMRNGSKAFLEGNDYTIKNVMLFETDQPEYVLLNERRDNHVLTESDLTRHFVPQEVVTFEQNEIDKE